MDDLNSPDELHRRLHGDARPVVIDVRGQNEGAAGHLPGALLISADEVPTRLAEIPAGRPVVTA